MSPAAHPPDARANRGGGAATRRASVKWGGRSPAARAERPRHREGRPRRGRWPGVAALSSGAPARRRAKWTRSGACGPSRWQLYDAPSPVRREHAHPGHRSPASFHNGHALAMDRVPPDRFINHKLIFICIGLRRRSTYNGEVELRDLPIGKLLLERPPRLRVARHDDAPAREPIQAVHDARPSLSIPSASSAQ